MVKPGNSARTQTVRLFGLAFALLSTTTPLTTARLRRMVREYADLSDAAFERKFEHDKADLRRIGMALEAVSVDGEVGYRLANRDHELPELEFTAGERAALALAGRAWARQALAEESRQALTTLMAAGIDIDQGAALALQPQVSADEQAFHPLWQATVHCRPVRFAYRAGQGEETRREVEPWALGYRGGRWYLTGFDRLRGAQRSFRLGRVQGEVEVIGQAGDYRVPLFDRDRWLQELPQAGATQQAVLAVREGIDLGVPSVAVEHAATPCGYRAVQVRVRPPREAAAQIAEWGADVLVLEPPALREAVVDHLEGVVRARGGER